jgi:hypothetical protein
LEFPVRSAYGCYKLQHMQPGHLPATFSSITLKRVFNIIYHTAFIPVSGTWFIQGDSQVNGSQIREKHVAKQ